MTTTILTADDDQAFRSMFSRLSHQDATFTLIGEAKPGEDAVCADQHLHPDIVMLDITMPGVNGFDASRRIKADRPQTKVIVRSELKRLLGMNASAPLASATCTKFACTVKLQTIHALMTTTAAAMAPRPARAESTLVIGNDAPFRRAVTDDLRQKVAAFVEESAGSEKEILAKVSALRPRVVAVAWEDSAAWNVGCLRGLLPDLGIVALVSPDSDARNETAYAAGTDAVVVKNRFESDLAPLVAALMRGDADGCAEENRADERFRADTAANAQKIKPRV